MRLPWEARGFRLLPSSVERLEARILAWARFRGLLPRATDSFVTVASAAPPRAPAARPFVMEHRYLHGSAIDQVLAQEDYVGNVRRMLADNLGTVGDALDSSGELVEHYEYDAFAQVAGDTSLARYLYTARDFDATTHLQYNRTRWYDASTGRWLGEDPIGFAGGQSNLFVYVGNSPRNAIYASGEAASTWSQNTWFELTAKVVGIKPGRWGGFEVRINWQVQPAPLKPQKSANLPATSWIIQHLSVFFDVTDAKTGQAVKHRADDGKWKYWEAWDVGPGKVSPTPKPGRAVDDIYMIPDGEKNTCGTIVFSGTAQFYPYTDLPADFVPNNPNSHAGILPSTPNGGAMTGLQARSFPPVVHTVIATWSKENAGRTKVVVVGSHSGPMPPDDPTA